MIEYKLEKNELTADPHDCRAVVVNTPVYSEEDIINRMLESGAGLTRSDILSVKAAYKQAVLGYVRQGGVVNDDLYNMSLAMPGKYSPLEEPNQYTLEVHLHPSHELREIVAHLKAKRVNVSGNEPLISVVQDVTTNGVDTISRGAVFLIKGHKIKVSGTHADVGIYLKNTANNAITKITARLAENTPSKLLLQAPNLAPGAYRLTIKTQYTGSGKDLREPRVIEYPGNITVV